jgi:hypothetical protein
MTSSALEGFKFLSLDDRKGREGEMDEHRQNALRQYTKAIRHMRGAVQSGKQGLRTTVLTCLVILCFEAWNGNHDLAVRQIQTGFRLIQAWRESLPENHTPAPLGFWSPKPDVVEHDLFRIFNNLDVQLISFASDRSPGYSKGITSQEEELLERIPMAFFSLDEAEIYESAIVRRAMRFISSKINLPRPEPPRRMFPVNGWYGDQSSEVVAKQQKLD